MLHVISAESAKLVSSLFTTPRLKLFMPSFFATHLAVAGISCIMPEAPTLDFAT